MKRYIVIIAIAIFALVAWNLSFNAIRFRSELRMGTIVSITLKAPVWSDFESTFDRAFDAIDKVDSIASIYDANSQITRLNRCAHLKPVVVSDELFFLVSKSFLLSSESEGAFDVTVLPLVKLWNSYKQKNLIPDDALIKEALLLVGYKNISLDADKKTIYFKKPGVSIDLSALAKGYAVDEAIRSIKESGFSSAIVNAGGDLYCLGRRSLFSPWSIGIIDPNNDSRVIKKLVLEDMAVATSGGYQQHYQYKGRDYTHIINPKTGYPIKDVFFSITVIAPNCLIADGIATAVTVGGDELIGRFNKIYPGVSIVVER